MMMAVTTKVIMMDILMESQMQSLLEKQVLTQQEQMEKVPMVQWRQLV